ncbi:glycosyltransferase family 2 protein [Lactiplantibacillus pingfangensis]|uniref:glycosyltransferase family 2 protein n=1 Tax=Lactiplantibacillus pingfangensis TaxID=2559915 RepID=UPI0010F467F0|nr:glycosyltransferase family 2 protein [Lactiplantibacillus pingfangensis]
MKGGDSLIVSIITTVYNRKAKMLRLFESLEKQTNKNFEWIIVDDKSNDDTYEGLKIIEESSCNFKRRIKYLQQNSGKHIALNYGIQMANGEITIIVDSDEVAYPEMISRVLQQWEISGRVSDQQLGVIVFERFSSDGSPLRKVPHDNVRANLVEYRYGNGLMGDYAETFKTSVLRKHVFPRFKDEKFLSEDYVWIDIGKVYDAIFIQQGIYTSRYDEDGLTFNSKRIMWDNPIGTMKLAEKRLSLKTPIYWKLKFIVVYMIFSFRNNVSIVSIFRKAPNKLFSMLLILPSYFVYRVMKSRFKVS